MVISLFLFKTLFASFIEEICWYFGVTTLISKRLNPNLGEFFSGSFEVRMDKIICHVTTQAHVTSEKIPFSTKAHLILLMPVSFYKKSGNFDQSRTFTQNNIVRAMLEIF